jgi:hypothetical protein
MTSQLTGKNIFESFDWLRLVLVQASNAFAGRD